MDGTSLFVGFVVGFFCCLSLVITREILKFFRFVYFKSTFWVEKTFKRPGSVIDDDSRQARWEEDEDLG